MALNFAPLLIGNSIMPLLPIYARSMGADVSVTGLVLGIIFASLSAGALFSGWLSDRFQQRRLTLFASAAVKLAALLLMSQTDNFAIFVVLTSIVWFAGGVTTSTIGILAGMQAGAASRGRTFGAIALGGGISQILAGVAAGTIVAQAGFQTLFLLLAGVQVIPLVVAVLIVRDVPPVPRQRKQASEQPIQSQTFWLLLGASVLAYIVSFGTTLGRTIMMEKLGFDPAAISSAVAITGIVATPLPFVLGTLSDRVGRHPLLALAYALTAVGTIILSLATTLGGFWLATIMFAMLPSGLTLSSALVTDTVPREALGSALSRLSTTPWIGGIIGFTGTGALIQALGPQPVFLLLAVLPVLSAGLVLRATPGFDPLARSIREELEQR